MFTDGFPPVAATPLSRQKDKRPQPFSSRPRLKHTNSPKEHFFARIVNNF